MLDNAKYEKMITQQFPELDNNQVSLVVENLITLADICILSYLKDKNGSKSKRWVIDNKTPEVKDEDK